jgi:hypothetical protein
MRYQNNIRLTLILSLIRVNINALSISHYMKASMPKPFNYYVNHPINPSQPNIYVNKNNLSLSLAEQLKLQVTAFRRA